jgi:enolase
MTTITNINSFWVLDSRGIPTIQCQFTIDKNGIKYKGVSSVPSGASTGSHEALELRDGNNEFHGKGVSKAINNINKTIYEAIVNRNFQNAKEIDELMIKLDNTPNKSNLGANAILAVSMAAHRAFANLSGIELWQYLKRMYFSELIATPKFPLLMCNIINGGAHADNNLSIQEFMIVPNTGSIESDIQAASEIYGTLKQNLKSDNYNISLGDEGGFAPKFNLENIVKSQVEESQEDTKIELSPTKIALRYIQKAINDSSYPNCKIAIDSAATEFYIKNKEGEYLYKIDGKELTKSDLANFYIELCEEFPILSIEDSYSEDDILGWEIITESLGKKINLIGDDLFVTNPSRFTNILNNQNNIANGILIKPNQIGSILETCQMINLAKEKNYTTAISHRSGETIDTFISDLAFASQSEFIKLGAPARGERVAKYNRLIEIKKNLE